MFFAIVNYCLVGPKYRQLYLKTPPDVVRVFLCEAWNQKYAATLPNGLPHYHLGIGPLNISMISENRSSKPKLVIHDPRKATFCVFAYINNFHETM